jgi:replicative DNA helicase
MSSEQNNEPQSIVRVPPQSFEAESSVLGALLLDNLAHDQISDLLSAKDFYRYEHQLIHSAICSLINTSRPADVITVFEQLQSDGEAETAGGLPYLNSLAQYVPSAAHIKGYAEVVRERSILRSLVSAGDAITASAFDQKGRAASDILEDAEKRILQIGEQGSSNKEEVKTLENQVVRFMDALQDRADNPGKRTGVNSGFIELDKLTDGFQAGDLVVIAGRPSMGKTSLAMNIAEHAALRQKLAVLVFSLEMPADQLTQRLVGSVGRIDQKDLKAGRLTDANWSRVSETLQKLHDGVLDIQDSGIETIGAIRAVARRALRFRKKLGLIVVDYIQLLNGGEGASENRATEVAQISRGLKLLAKEMQCPVIALSQLNRKVEDRGDKRPMMSDLRDSGAIEQDADTIMFVYRDEVYTKEACRDPGVAEIIIGKQRNGPTGTVRLAWSPQYTRFDSLAYG